MFDYEDFLPNQLLSIEREKKNLNFLITVCHAFTLDTAKVKNRVKIMLSIYNAYD